MKILLWSVALVFALVWTACIALLASVANWVAGAGDQVVGAAQRVAEWSAPAWAAVWMDLAWLDGVRAALTWTIDALTHYAPWLFGALGWVAPLLWGLWVLGMLVLLAVAAVGQVLLGRVPRSAE